jgi:hypothetical protein
VGERHEHPPLVSAAVVADNITPYCSRILCYNIGMGVEWTRSADKHGVSREYALYALMNYEVSAEVEGERGETTIVYIGHPHAQTDRYIEVIAAHRVPRTIVIFHAMPLTGLFRYLLHKGD